MSTPLLQMTGVSKHFTLHNQGGATLRVLDNANLSVDAGECVILQAPSGMGKSTLLKLVYASYRASGGHICVRDVHGENVDVTNASAQTLVRLRRESMAYVSQFLRVIPRVSALDLIAEPLIDAVDSAEAVANAHVAAKALLQRLSIPERLWHLPPATFSGGEQQRINIARSLIKPKALVLLDEPTASLDRANTEVVVQLINEAREQGSAIVGVFHDSEVGVTVATRYVDVADFRGSV
jgi:alpha-D-ribose 1-methylphosphonate 5-triphosphate synthase subunit PhnL